MAMPHGMAWHGLSACVSLSVPHCSPMPNPRFFPPVLPDLQAHHRVPPAVRHCAQPPVQPAQVPRPGRPRPHRPQVRGLGGGPGTCHGPGLRAATPCALCTLCAMPSHVHVPIMPGHGALQPPPCTSPCPGPNHPPAPAACPPPGSCMWRCASRSCAPPATWSCGRRRSAGAAMDGWA